MAKTIKQQAIASEYASLSEAKVRAIREDYVPHRMTVPKLAQKYGVTQRTVERIIYPGKETKQNV